MNLRTDGHPYEINKLHCLLILKPILFNNTFFLFIFFFTSFIIICFPTLLRFKLIVLLFEFYLIDSTVYALFVQVSTRVMHPTPYRA